MKKLIICVVAMLATNLTHATEIAIGGFSPVAYFTEGAALQGNADFVVEHKGNHYQLRNAEEVDLFNAEPDKYAPRYQLCPYSLARGQKMPLDPTNFQIIGGHLLLFHKSDKGDGLVQFRESGLTDQQLLDRADKQFTLLKF